MPKIVDRQEMQNAILDAAMRVFADKGYHAASVRNVAEAAGLGKGTIYIYFDSKEALTTALVDRHFADVSKRIMSEKRCKTLEGFLDTLNRAVDVPAEQAAFYRVFFEIFGPSFASDAFTAKIAAFFDRLGSHYARQIKHLQKVGEVSPHHDAAAIGRMLAGMLDGIVLHQALFGISAKRHRRIAEAAVSVLATGLRPEQPQLPHG